MSTESDTVSFEHARKVAADTRKLCTCDGAGRGPGRPCVVKAGGRLGELWRCEQGAEPTQPQIARCLDDADLSHL